MRFRFGFDFKPTLPPPEIAPRLDALDQNVTALRHQLFLADMSKAHLVAEVTALRAHVDVLERDLAKERHDGAVAIRALRMHADALAAQRDEALNPCALPRALSN